MGANPSPTVGHKGSSISLNSVLCQGSARKLPLLVIARFLDVLQSGTEELRKTADPASDDDKLFAYQQIPFVLAPVGSLFGIFNFALRGRAMC